MKLLVLFGFFLGSSYVRAEGEDFLSALKDCKETFHESIPSDKQLQASDNLLKKWDQLNHFNKERWAEKVALVHFRKASIYADNGDFAQASKELTEEIKIQATFGGQIEYSTRMSDVFFKDLSELQAQVTAETGSNPLVGQVGYFFEKEGDGFTAARLELYNDIAGITVPDIASDEGLALVYRINRQGNKFVASTAKWLVVPKGELPVVLKQAKREVVFDSTGKMTVLQLQTKADVPLKVANDAPIAPQVPQGAQKPAPGTNDVQSSPSTSSNEPVSSTRWSLVAFVVAAVIGLLGLLLKKRK